MLRTDFYKERKKYINKMWDELIEIQMELVDDKKVYTTNRVDFGFSKYHFALKNITSDDCRLVKTYFSCDTLETLRKNLEWILVNTAFREVTAFVENKSYVTFYSKTDLEKTFDYYYR